jgi:hypothetical protein
MRLACLSRTGVERILALVADNQTAVRGTMQEMFRTPQSICQWVELSTVLRNIGKPNQTYRYLRAKGEVENPDLRHPCIFFFFYH